MFTIYKYKLLIEDEMPSSLDHPYNNIFAVKDSFSESTVESEAYSLTVPENGISASIDMIGGKSVVWNQINSVGRYDTVSSVYGITRTKTDDGGVRVRGTCTKSANFTCTEVINFKGNHKYLVGLGNRSLPNGCVVQIASQRGSSVYLYSRSADRTISFEIYIPTDVVCDFVLRPFATNLTQMFGAGNEPTSVDDPRIKAIEEYAEAHPQYNVGELMSSQTDAIGVYKADKTLDKQIPTNLPILRSAGSVHDSIEGGKLIRRVGAVDLGTLSWNKTGQHRFYSTSISSLVMPTASALAIPQVLSDRYVASSFEVAYVESTDKIVAVTNQQSGSKGNLNVVDSAYTDATAFKNAMQGVTLYYELAEPIVTDIDPIPDLKEWLEVEAGGTITFKQANDTMLAIPNTVTYTLQQHEDTALIKFIDAEHSKNTANPIWLDMSTIMEQVELDGVPSNLKIKQLVADYNL